MPLSSLPPKQIPAAWAVLAISMALVGVLAAAIVLLAWNSYRDAIDRTRVRAESSAQVVATHIEWLMAAGVQQLEEADVFLGPRPFESAPSAIEHLRFKLKYLPMGVRLSLVDLTGKALVSTGPGEMVDLTPDEGLEVASLTGNRDWYVSAAVLPRPPGEAKDIKYFAVARRLERNGATVGAVVLRIPESVMSDFWRSLDLGTDSTVGLLRDDGWLVARFPPAPAPTNLKDYVLFTDLLKTSDKGIYETMSPVDGITRIVGYHKVPNAPLIAVASVSRDYALERLWDQLEKLALFLIPLVAGIAALASWVAKLLRRDDLMRASLIAAVEKNNLLMREIHHRTKNNLQSVASLIKLQPISEDAKAEMNARIGAMSAVHEQAYRSDLYSDVDLKDYLTLLIGNIERSNGKGIGFSADLAPMMIDRDLAQPLGLVVNEVISNALKHAFDGKPQGRIAVSLRLIADGKAELVIHDNGSGFIPSESDRGMGTRLIRAFAQQLGNDFEYTVDNGTRFAIRFDARSDAKV